MGVTRALTSVSGDRRRLASVDAGPQQIGDVPDCIGWWDASQITGLADTDAVTAWDDLSSAGRDLAQATGSRQPTYRTGIKNGLPVVRFDGGDVISGTAHASTVMSIVVVCAKTGGGWSAALCNGTSSGLGLSLNTSTGYGMYFNGVVVKSRTPGYSLGTWNVIAMTTSSTNLQAFYLDGELYITDDANMTTPSTGMHIGGDQNPSLTGDVGEVGLFDRVLTATEIAQLTAVLRRKWGI